MSFANIEDAFKFYNSYAKVAGFSIRKGSKNKKKNVVVWKKYVRAKEGQRVENSGTDSLAKTWENCDAEFQVNKKKKRSWEY